ncbi:MAG: DUF721 domain-containing protein [Bacteroidaceae bacterium]|nr:DUF721 domain-containing protein [Bacteroidaceae bacterium]
MRRCKPTLIKELVYAMLRQEGLETPLNEHRALQAWPEIVGPRLSRFAEAQRIRDEKLYVKVSKPALRQDLIMGRAELVRRICEQVGANVITDIVFF